MTRKLPQSTIKYKTIERTSQPRGSISGVPGTLGIGFNSPALRARQEALRARQAQARGENVVAQESQPAKAITPALKKVPLVTKGKVAVGIGLIIASIFGGREIASSRKAAEQAHFAQVGRYEKMFDQRKVVRNPKEWAEIAIKLGWSPVMKKDLEKIVFVDKISEVSGRSPETVLNTLKTYGADIDGAVRALRWSNKDGKNNRLIEILIPAAQNEKLAYSIAENLRGK